MRQTNDTHNKANKYTETEGRKYQQTGKIIESLSESLSDNTTMMLWFKKTTFTVKTVTACQKQQNIYYVFDKIFCFIVRCKQKVELHPSLSAWVPEGQTHL